MASYACHAERCYPTPEQQRRFIKAYVEHRPKISTASSACEEITPSSTPLLNPQATTPTPSSSSIVEFMLDARVPPGGWKEEERRATELCEEKICELLRETRLWRAMNSAFWIAWGIVQAKIPGYSDDTPDANGHEAAPASPVGSEGTVTGESGSGGDGEDEEEGFDYLLYVHERALFFWGDCVQMGLVKMEELPEELRANIKIVEY